MKPLDFGFEPGDVAPMTHGMRVDKAFYSFDDQAGRAAALIFAADGPPAAAAPVLQAFQQRAAALGSHEADAVALFNMQALNGAGGPDWAPGVTKVFCEGQVLDRWRLRARDWAVVVIDRGARIVDAFDAAAGDADAVADAALSRIAALPSEEPSEISLPAPVLIIPNILSRKFCCELIEHFEASNYVRGGMASRDARGVSFHKIDEAKKRRYDFVLGPKDPFVGRVLEGIIRRCIPEVKKAFNVDIRHTDRILVARYDDDGGYFRRHRDNAAPGVEFRQFALSINLNDDYEGGQVMFPEYNSHRYKPKQGAGVVFSCSLLHEASSVVKGRRYVALTFLHDAAAQARWLANGGPK